MQTELIAEIGVNWKGDLDIADYLISECKRIGFDAVKFQAFGPEHYSKYPQFPNLDKTSINQNNIKFIDRVAKRESIEWFATPTNTNAVDLLDAFVKRFKVRFADQNNSTLLAKVFSTKKPVIISTTKPEQFSSNIKTLYCIPKYPTPYEEIEFEKIPFYYGYSNHCKDKRAIINAAKRGAKLIEFHITPSYEENYIDNPVSFNMADSEDIICQVRKLSQ